MKIFSIPQMPTSLIFDIDSTLYTNHKYADEQVDIQIRYFADLQGVSHDTMRKKIAEYRKNWAASNNGKSISLGNTLVAFGVPISESIEWRKKLLEPNKFLSVDYRLQSTLKLLKTRFKIICVTNNPVLPAKKTLEAIGIDSFFTNIIGLDTCGISKPNKEVFFKAANLLNAQYCDCISIGDRFDIDLSLPLEIGMGAILVDGVEDVYKLPSILLP